MASRRNHRPVRDSESRETVGSDQGPSARTVRGANGRGRVAVVVKLYEFIASAASAAEAEFADEDVVRGRARLAGTIPRRRAARHVIRHAAERDSFKADL